MTPTMENENDDINAEKDARYRFIAFVFGDEFDVVSPEDTSDGRHTSKVTITNEDSSNDKDIAAGDATTIKDVNQYNYRRSNSEEKQLQEYFPSVSQQHPTIEETCDDSMTSIMPRHCNTLVSSTSRSSMELSGSRSSNESSDDPNRATRRHDTKQRRSHWSTVANGGTLRSVGAIAVPGNRSSMSAWEDDDDDDDTTSQTSGVDDGHGDHEGRGTVTGDDRRTGPNLPTARMVTQENDNGGTDLEVALARERFIAETREEIAGQLPRADPVTAQSAVIKSRLRRLILFGGLLLLSIMAAVSIALLVMTRRRQSNVTTSAPATIITASPSTNSPSNSPIVLLRDGRKAFTTTVQLQAAADEYSLMLKSSAEPELSDVAVQYGYPIGTWDVSRVTDFSRVFDPDRSQTLVDYSRNPREESSFDEDLSGWNVSNAITLHGMFAAANSFTGKGLEHWDVGKVTDFSFLFAKASIFRGNVSLWNTSSAVTMDGMFSDAWLFNGDLSQWDVSRVSSMAYMFHFARAYEGSDLRKWNVAKVINMGFMFALSVFKGKVSTWDTSKVTIMEKMFAMTLVNDDLSSWSVGKVTTMRGMFSEAELFQGSNLNYWNTSSVTDMKDMFYKAKVFNGNISLWDVAKVENFDRALSYAKLYDGDLSRWQTRSALTMSSMFYRAESFSGVNISSWDTSKVVTMNSMFAFAYSFNTDLSTWDVSSLTDASSMFFEASVFDQSLCSWGGRLPSSVIVVGMFVNSSCPNMSDPSAMNGTIAGPFCHTCIT